jgi:colanic acid/amylovoran biosynthesis glycosyltransferase
MQMTSLKSRDRLLVVTPSVPAYVDENGWFLDEKAVSGLRLYAELWPGPVRSVFRAGARSGIGFGRRYERDELPFDVCVIPEASHVSDDLVSDAVIVLASGDNWLDFPIAEQGNRFRIPVCFIIENTFGTRASILFLSRASATQKLKSLIWLVHNDLLRRSAFRMAGSIQSNGTAAAETYGSCATNVLTFFDTRLRLANMATEDDVRRKTSRLMSGAPLRLVFTGRLERIKGADHLIKVVSRLPFPFKLDIYGAGELRGVLTSEVKQCGLDDLVSIHDPIDFDSALVPTIRSEADLFLCCHVQSDPSCTYLETLGCGVPIVGYANGAWSGILSRADVGWSVSNGRYNQMAQVIANLHDRRSDLCVKMQNAVTFARRHSLEQEFERRIDQLVLMSGDPPRYSQ